MSRLLFSVSEFNSNGVVLNFGGNFNDQNPNYGLFYLNGNNRASDANNNAGARQLVFHCADFRGALAHNQPSGHGLVQTHWSVGTAMRLTRNEMMILVKRADNLFPILISDENILEAIQEVNKTHRYGYRHRPRNTVAWIEETMPERVQELRQIVTDGFVQQPGRRSMRYDQSARKWRNIWEPKLWPDQYIHHMLIQVLKPLFLRQMDPWCCGSVPGRGTIKGVRGIQKWMKNDIPGTRWCAELDVHHYYDSLTKEVVMGVMRRRIKDAQVLGLIEATLAEGVPIGSYCSQWYANAVLQDCDRAIRAAGATHYVRYVDNFTIFARRKKDIRRCVHAAEAELAKLGLCLKGNWQYFQTRHRMPNALGYRYRHGYTLVRKGNLLRFKRQVARMRKRVAAGKPVPRTMAAGILSRAGQLCHCNGYRLRRRWCPPREEAFLKAVVAGRL